MAPVPPYNFRDEDFQDVGLGSRVSGFRVYLEVHGYSSYKWGYK